jgi:dTDP-4-amino-4,6-dideoxygalactose transaminase
LKIPLIKPYLPPETKKRVWEVLESGYLTEGPVTAEFESAVKNFIGCRHAIAVTSCTTGLEIALRALNIGPGDEVIVPDYTYPATADAVAIVGATVVIVDVSPQTMLIDYDALESAVTDRTKAIIPVSLFGNPLDHDILAAIRKKYDLYIIEDAACSLGAEYKGQKIGTQADISVFSLHPRKFITTGEGGLITTENDAWANWMQSYKHFGMAANHSRSDTVFQRIGTNYKLNNILAAVGLSQMQHIDDMLTRRIELAQNYNQILKHVSGVALPETTAQATHSYQSYCIFVKDRDQVLNTMRERGIEVQIGTYALHKHKAFFPSDFCVVCKSMTGSNYAFDHCLALPLYHDISQHDQQLVVENLIQAMGG